MAERVLVLASETLVVHRATCEAVIGSAADALGLSVEIVWGDRAALGRRLHAAPPMTVVVPDVDLEVVDLVGAGRLGTSDVGDASTEHGGIVRFDLYERGRDRSPQVSQHLRGLGVGGLTWAVRAAVHGARDPAEVVAYGDHDESFGHLRLPRTTDGPAPVVALLHGGYWRSRWQLDLMDALAVDLSDRGYAAWNLEYRRPDRHGWEATVADVCDGVRHVADLSERFGVTPSKVVIVGHSAGGQLALQAAEELAAEVGPVSPVAAVSLAGVVDLAEAHARQMGEGAVQLALGGTPAELPDRYRVASPAARGARRVPTVVVQGADDDPDLVEMNRRFVARSRSTGASIVAVERPGDHFAVIDPASEVWHATVAAFEPFVA